MNICPTETPEFIEYRINGIEGGMITPRPPEIATNAALNVRSYPREVRIGMVIAPTAAVVAGAEPEIAP